MLLLNLPTELLEQILGWVPTSDLPSCALAHYYLNQIVRRSALLRYKFALLRAGAENSVNLNPKENVSYHERLKLLNRRESAWSNLKPASSRHVPTGFAAGGLYDLCDGVYVLQDRHRHRLLYLPLQNLTWAEEPKWVLLETNDDERLMIDFGMSIHEHDLIAIITSFVNPSSVPS